MKKLLKKESIVAFFTYTLIFTIIYIILTNTEYFFGSNIDFKMQHYIIPEYFRTLFYKTYDLLPDFALNLSGGINIFYLSYYGLFSPIILLSYFFPCVSMLNFIIISTSIIVVISAFLMYKYLRNNNYSFITSYLGGIILLLAAPITFHAHRHIMFINYMPFLIMGMYGVDKYFKTKKGSLLAISIFLMIMTSYYYSVGGIVALVLLGIYKYLSQNKFQIKTFTKQMLSFSVPFIIGILLGMIIILPTLYTLLNGREKGNIDINILSLITPSLDFKNILYSAYSTGLTAIAVLSALYLTFNKKAKIEERFLSIITILIGTFPIFNYILNGTLYMDSKSLIPLIPLIIIIICTFLEKLFKNEINYKLIFKTIAILIILGIINIILLKQNIINENLTQNIMYLVDLCLLTAVILTYKYLKKPIIIVLYLIIFLFITSLRINLSDNLIPKEEYINDEKIINEITKNDNTFYRINNLYLDSTGLNKIYNPNHLSSTIYSSAFNQNYNKFYYDVFNNPITYRNRSMTAPSSNILFHNYIGEKYIITNKNMNLGYESIIKENVRIYENEDAFPIGYATSKILNKEDYNYLTYPNTAINLLKSVVTAKDKTNTKPLVLEKTNIDYEVLDYSNLEIEKLKSSYKINSKKDGNLKIKIKNDMKNKVLFIRFKNNYDPSCSNNDLAITINGTMNKLTCKSWKYHNQNFDFDYSIYNQDILNITFDKGLYDLSDLTFYILDYNEVKSLNKQIDHFIIDKEKTIKDTINGSIYVKEDGYFVIQIPYDKGFTISVDNNNQPYENVNEGFIGFKIKRGQHTINIKYDAPYKKAGIALNIVGLTLLIIYSIITYRRRNNIWKSYQL